MKLIIGIINKEDVQVLLETLSQKGYQVTTIATTDGVLPDAKAVILTSANDVQVESVLSLIKEICPGRTRYSNPLPPNLQPGEIFLPPPLEQHISGATVFVLNLDQVHRY